MTWAKEKKDAEESDRVFLKQCEPFIKVGSSPFKFDLLSSGTEVVASKSRSFKC